MAGNPGPGGWAAVIMYENESIFIKKRISGGEENTINNKKAVINGLKKSLVRLSDSLYVKQVMDQ